LSEFDIGAAAHPVKLREIDESETAEAQQTDETLQASFGGASWFTHAVDLYDFVDEDEGE
jgi:hypothetical protein